MLEVAEAVTKAWDGEGILGIHLSPLPGNTPVDGNPMDTYGTLVERLGRYGLAYRRCIEGVTQGSREQPNGISVQALRRSFSGR